MPRPTTAPSATVSLYDARPFFEKALQYGMAHGLISSEKLAAISVDAPKGMVQIARYFGNENLRPELEKARDRIVNLVSLNLELSSDGDLQVAAEMLRDHSFLSRSKGGSDLLKALIAMPLESYFIKNHQDEIKDENDKDLLADWALNITLPEYQIELAKRRKVSLDMEAAIWLAEKLGLQVKELEESAADFERVIRTAILVLASAKRKMSDWIAFEETVMRLRKKYDGANAASSFTFALPKGLPIQFHPVIERVRQGVVADLPKILNPKLDARELFDPLIDRSDDKPLRNHKPSLEHRYFWIDNSLNEVDHLARSVSKEWSKVTKRHTDEGSLLSLFLCISTESKPKTIFTVKEARTLIKKIRKQGFKEELVKDYIAHHAPHEFQHGYQILWANFVEEARSTLLSDHDYAHNDALALLREQCNVM